MEDRTPFPPTSSSRPEAEGRSGETPVFCTCSQSQPGEAEINEFAYVYILASGFKHLYIGLTTKIEQRIWEHKNGGVPGSFTDRYNIRELVYLEQFGSIQTAIAREKQLKRWSRVKKIRLIVESNPTWRDLSADWGKPIAPFREPDDNSR